MNDNEAETILFNWFAANNPDREGWNCAMTALKTYLIHGKEHTAERTIQRAKTAAKALSKAQLAEVEILVVAELRAKRLMNA